MKDYDAYEVAYKNGYRKAIEDVSACRIGQTAWGFGVYGGRKHIKSGEISEVYFMGEEMRLCAAIKGLSRGVWGKDIFATREEAERALYGK